MSVKKNIYLTLILAVLLAVSLGLHWWEPNNARSGVDPGLFALSSVDGIDRMVMKQGDQVLDFTATTRGFMINEKYPIDAHLLNVLGAVLQQVQVQRPLAADENNRAWARLQSKGTHVSIFEGENQVASYWAGGDESKELSYFATDQGKVYIVTLPGYTSYVSGIFELSPQEWRGTSLFLNTWRSLLSFSYKNHRDPNHNFEIRYRDPFFEVIGVQQLDSNRVVNYLQELENLRASSLVDTVYQGDAWLELTTVDIDDTRNGTLLVYGEPGDDRYLAAMDGQYYLIARERLQPLIRQADYFSMDR